MGSIARVPKAHTKRTNVSREVLDRNYDARTQSEKREVRRQYLRDI